ncbi:MAG: phosphatase PAP2 family protein, partial [bacterium]
MNHFIFLLPTLKHIGMLGYWIVLLIAFAESLVFIGSIIPGALLVVFFGFLAARGVYTLGDLILFVAIGAILGYGISYYLGAKGKQYFSDKSKFLKRSHLENGEQFFHRHREKSVLLSRFVAPIRSVVPFVAGTERMNVWSFVFWNIIGAFVWTITHLFIGYFFGCVMNTMEIWSTRAGFFSFLLLLLFFCIWLIIKKGNRFFRFLWSLLLSIKEAVTNNPDIRVFAKDHPIFCGFIRQRVRRDRFSGLPLTLLLAAFMYIVFLFFGIVEGIFTSHVIIGADIRIANLLFVFRNSGFIMTFLWITLLAKWQIVVAIAVSVSSLCWIWHKRLYIVPLWITILGAGFFNILGKLIIHRPRPEVAYYIENSFSFPSGHATIVVAFYGFIAYILFREIKNWEKKTFALFIAAVIICAVGFSRLYLGVHYLSDVWGGYLLGLLWLIIGISITEWFVFRGMEMPHRVFSTKLKAFSILIIMPSLIFYVSFAVHYNPLLSSLQTDEEQVIENDPLVLFEENGLSRYSETLAGGHQEPLSFLIVVNDDAHLISDMEKAGWYLADPLDIS